MNDDIKVIDNFLPKYSQNEFLSLFNNQKINWNYYKEADGAPSYQEFKKNDDLISEYDQFARVLNYQDDKYWFDIISLNTQQHLNFSINILRMRMVFSIARINVNPRSYGIPHVDRIEPHYTLIYYANDSNCNTIIFKESFHKNWDYSKKTIDTLITPKKGRAVIFNGLRYHTVELYNTSNRFLLNVNFKPNAE